ncbi:hypothetical protein [Nitrospira sp. Nam74]
MQALEDHRAIKGSRATRHMKMAEEELFGHAREVTTQQEAEELGTKVEMAKKELRGEAPAPAGGIPE